VAGTHVRIYTVESQKFDGLAIQVARPLTEVDHALSQIRLILLLVTLGGVAIAAALGLGVARTALAPVRRLMRTTEHVTETGDLTSRIDTPGRRDELSRLAASFNTMLAALEQSVNAQRALVVDASHELRTPLTSLRTNIEVLARNEDMPPAERDRLLADVVEQLAEMSALVAELVELARGETPEESPEDVRLDLLVSHTVDRARRNANGIQFETALEESTVHGVPRTIERAVANLLDNAVKWSPPDGTVAVSVRGGEVSVRDHGPGIAEDDLPHVFDRFYRAPAARGLPGSGLGLAIVKQVAEANGGEVVAERPEGGGTLMRLRLRPAGG
jgi:two-component system sensor histidine kinase MprB